MPSSVFSTFLWAKTQTWSRWGNFSHDDKVQPLELVTQQDRRKLAS